MEDRYCVICGKKFSTSHNALTCSKACSDAYHRNWDKEYKRKINDFYSRYDPKAEAKREYDLKNQSTGKKPEYCTFCRNVNENFCGEPCVKRCISGISLTKKPDGRCKR